MVTNHGRRDGATAPRVGSGRGRAKATVKLERKAGVYRSQAAPEEYLLAVRPQGMAPEERGVRVDPAGLRERFLLVPEGMPFYYRGRVRAVPAERPRWRRARSRPRGKGGGIANRPCPRTRPAATAGSRADPPRARAGLRPPGTCKRSPALRVPRPARHLAAIAP